MREFTSEANRFLNNFLTPAVKTILLINLAVMLFLAILYPLMPLMIERLIYFFGQSPKLSVQRLHVWQFVTYAFMHLEFFHLLFNMLILWFFGPPLEQRWGTRRFWNFYLVVAAGAGLFHAILTLGLGLGDPTIPVIGASGAMFGIMIAFWAYHPEQPVYIYGIFPIKMKYLMPILLLLNFLATTSPQAGNVSYLTHLSGAGVAYCWLARRHRDWNFRTWRWTRDW